MEGSILFWEKQKPQRAEGAFWQDLNLDQLAEDLGRPGFNLEDVLRRPVSAADQIRRQAVFRDLEQPEILEKVQRFSAAVADMDRRLERQKRITNIWQLRWNRLADCLHWTEAMVNLEQGLAACSLQSRGLQSLRQAVEQYNRESQSAEVLARGREIRQDLEQLPLRIQIYHNHIEILEGGPGEDYSQTLARLFSGFRDRQTRDYTYNQFTETPYLNHVEEEVVRGAATLAPELFDRLNAFAGAHEQPVSARLRQLYEELQFYLACEDYLEPVRQQGLPICYAEESSDGSICLEECFDLNLFHRLCGKPVVCNSFRAGPKERRFTITGANQGGKTTYARMVGQVLYLASLGVPVPGRRVERGPVDAVLTHFEREETVATENGKLMEDLQRLHGLLDRATAHSVLILNETFSSTTLEDGVWLARRVLAQAEKIGCLCLYVTFLGSRLQSCPGLHRLQTRLGPDGAPTFVVERAQTDGSTCAVTLARQHRLLYEQIKERIQP